jgi:signal peptidase I
MLRLFKVTGKSLEPIYQEGDFVLASKIPFYIRAPRPGDFIVFRHARLGVLIKCIERVTPLGALYVTGTRPSSHDSDDFGVISPGDVLGKVVAAVRKNQRQNNPD